MDSSVNCIRRKKKKKKPYWLKSSGAIAANFSTALEKFRVSWKLFGAADP